VLLNSKPVGLIQPPPIRIGLNDQIQLAKRLEIGNVLKKYIFNFEIYLAKKIKKIEKSPGSWEGKVLLN